MLQLVHDLRADRHIERRHRFIQHDQPRIGHQRPRDGDALTLAATEFMRKQVGDIRLQSHQLQHLDHSLPNLRRETGRCGSPAVRR